MGFESNQNMYVKEQSPVESSSRNTTLTSRSENNSFKGKKGMANGRSNTSSNRNQNEASASSQHYQSNSFNFPINPVMDSGYGSLDKLKTDGSNQMRSPVLTRRLSNKIVRQAVKANGNSFDSDDGGSDDRGSSGFVNTIGGPLKDTAYDYVRMKK